MKSEIEALVRQLPEPKDYFRGVDIAHRPVCRSVLVFQRASFDALQQRQLINRLHHRYVLLQVLRTAGTVSLDGTALRLKEGEALLILPYQFHHYIETSRNALQWLFVTFELVQGQTLMDGLSHRVMLPDPQREEALRAVVEVWNRSPVSGQAAVLPLVDSLLLGLVQRLHSGRHFAAGVGSGSWVAQVENLVIRSVREGWTLAEVARRAGLSERHLRTRFSRAMGISLAHYRRHYQLHQAAVLLRGGQHRLSGVAELCGFRSPAVFSRFIRRETGQSPREWAKSLSATV